MAKERTLVMIKPDAIERGLVSDIFDELDRVAKTKKGSRIKTVEILGEQVTQELIEQHYAGLIVRVGDAIKKQLVPYFIGKKLIVAIYEGGEGIRKAIKEKVGPTDPAKAGEDTIRGKWGDDSLEDSFREKRAVRNLAHASDWEDCGEEFRREYYTWERFF